MRYCLFHMFCSDYWCRCLHQWIMMSTLTACAYLECMNHYKKDLWCCFINLEIVWETKSRCIFNFFFFLSEEKSPKYLEVNGLNHSHDFTQAALSYCISRLKRNISVFFLVLAWRLWGAYLGRGLTLLYWETKVYLQLKYNLVRLAKFARLQWTAKSSTSCNGGLVSVFQQQKMMANWMFSVARQRITGSSHSHFNCFYGLGPQSVLLITA